MDILVYPSTHAAAAPVSQSLTTLLVPHYLPQVISPATLASPGYPWHSTCALLVLLELPGDRTAVQKYIELGGRLLALGGSALQSHGLFGIYQSLSCLNGFPIGGIGGDRSTIRIAEGQNSFHISFPTCLQPSSTNVSLDAELIPVFRIPTANLNVDPNKIDVLARFTGDDSPASVVSQSGRIAICACGPPLHEKLLRTTLTALGLRCSADPATDGQPSGVRILPQLLLAHPSGWVVQAAVLQALFPERDLNAVWSSLDLQPNGNTASHEASEFLLSKEMIFSDECNSFHFHVANERAPVSGSEHPILQHLPPSARSSEENIKHVVLPKNPLTLDEERLYTPFFSPSTFFSALDELRDRDHGTYTDPSSSWRIGDALLYGEVVTSTQSMLDNIRLPLRDAMAGTPPARSIRASNLVFIQYLFALAVVDACRVLDPSGSWSERVRLKWPNDIYGEFPAHQAWTKSEFKKLGGILVNLSFGGGMVDIIIGCGLNILNEAPIASLAQLQSLAGNNQASPPLRVERVTAAILAAFERIWESFLANEERGFEPFLGRYVSRWLHSNQIVKLTTTTPHIMVRIESITTDHGLLRTVPLGDAHGRYFVVAPNLLGHGFRQGTDFHLATLAGDLHPYLTQDHYDAIIGHSSRRISVILVDPSLHFSPEFIQEKKEEWANDVAHVKSVETFMAENPTWKRVDATTRVIGLQACASPDVVRKILEQNNPWSVGHMLTQMPENVTITVLIASPEVLDDVPSHPSIQTVVVPGVSHWVQYEAPEVIINTALQATAGAHETRF
ncbi:hypothetical protein ID866_5597 [Astraeus odoratus]|nr:hypothetical protein ID866_5597 [Astraeus odoratus]